MEIFESLVSRNYKDEYFGSIKEAHFVDATQSYDLYFSDGFKVPSTERWKVVLPFSSIFLETSNPEGGATRKLVASWMRSRLLNRQEQEGFLKLNLIPPKFLIDCLTFYKESLAGVPFSAVSTPPFMTRFFVMEDFKFRTNYEETGEEGITAGFFDLNKGTPVENPEVEVGGDRADLLIKLTLPFWFSVYMMNISGVHVIPQKRIITRQQRRQAERKGESLPVETYHVIELSGNRKEVESSITSEEGSRKSLHICRGHIARYYGDSKLFGKYNGEFWIPETIKGDPKVGISAHAYKVVPK